MTADTERLKYAALMAALFPVLDAAKMNDIDPVGNIRSDDHVVWRGPGDSRITIGDLRAIRKAAYETELLREVK